MKNFYKWNLILVLAIIAILLSGCALPPSQEDVQGEGKSAPAEESSTPVPTPVPSATPTLVPSETPAPTPTPLPRIVEIYGIFGDWIPGFLGGEAGGILPEEVSDMLHELGYTPLLGEVGQVGVDGEVAYPEIITARDGTEEFGFYQEGDGVATYGEMYSTMAEAMKHSDGGPIKTVAYQGETRYVARGDRAKVATEFPVYGDDGVTVLAVIDDKTAGLRIAVYNPKSGKLGVFESTIETGVEGEAGVDGILSLDCTYMILDEDGELVDAAFDANSGQWVDEQAILEQAHSQEAAQLCLDAFNVGEIPDSEAGDLWMEGSYGDLYEYTEFPVKIHIVKVETDVRGTTVLACTLDTEGNPVALQLDYPAEIDPEIEEYFYQHVGDARFREVAEYKGIDVTQDGWEDLLLYTMWNNVGVALDNRSNSYDEEPRKLFVEGEDLYIVLQAITREPPFLDRQDQTFRRISASIRFQEYSRRVALLQSVLDKSLFEQLTVSSMTGSSLNMEIIEIEDVFVPCFVISKHSKFLRSILQ